ncbi:MAG: rhodanese-like domain-containing protein [Thermomicrobiales bacterium]
MPETIAIDQLKSMRETRTPHALIDVREKGEFVQRHIFHAVPIPRGVIELRVPQRIPDTEVPIIVYDEDGHRATLAAQRLESMGYSDVRTLEGGLNAWEESGGRTDYGTNVPGKDFGEKVAVQRKIPHLTPDEIVERQKRNERLIILDSRTREEYERNHVPGAFSAPGAELPRRIRTIIDAPENRDATIVVNCAGRTRSILGADVLIRMGIENPVYALENGTMAWSMAGHDLESGEGADIDVASAPSARQIVEEFANRVAQEDNVQPLSVEDFKAMRNDGTLHYALDARLPQEFAEGHIPCSVSLPGGQVALAADEIVAVNQAPIVFISESGMRAAITGSFARQIGYPNVMFLEGGIEAWTADGNELTTDEEDFEVPGLADAVSATSSITPDDLARSKGDADPLIVDVKGSGDYALEHIEGSRWVPRGDLERRIGNYVDSKDQQIILTCNNGVRSALAAKTLQDDGYTNVKWLEGGLDAWKASGRDVVEGLDGADVSVREAKDDVEMIGRVGPLARSRQDMIDYLEWEIALGHKYETE